jgi:Copper amine oxidase, enzyme domain
MADWGDLHLVSGAGWSAYWRISKAEGSGLEIWFADYMNKRVLWRGTQPFAIVPYHHPLPFPKSPEFTFKDGLNPMCDGAAFTALKHWAPNAGDADVSWSAAKDTEAVVVKVEGATDFESASLTINAKFQCGWYQYVHSWEFNGYGNIHPRLAMGGQLNPYAPDKAHSHHMYFRIDLDIDGYPSDVFEEFNHKDYTDPGGDDWGTPLSSQGKLLANPPTTRKWRVRDALSKNALGQHRGYEIEVPQAGGTDAHSTGDVWVTVYRGDDVEQGAEVGASCNDKELESSYAVGSLDPVNGNDVVLWVAIHAHHEPRDLGEESVYLPYHYAEFSITPRNFEVFKEPLDGGEKG